MKQIPAAFLAFCISISASADSGVRAVLVPAGPSVEVSEATLIADAQALAGVEEASWVFDLSEREFLVKAGQKDLARSLNLRLSDSETLDSLKKQLAHATSASIQGRLQSNAKLNLRSNSEQWGLHNTGLPQEVEITDILSRTIRAVPGEDAGLQGAPAELAGNKVLVAVIDTGVDKAHPAISGRLHRSESECQAKVAYEACLKSSTDKELCNLKFATLDTDGNGYPLDCSGWSVLGSKDARTGITGSADPQDDIGHGTHVSGIIGASGFVEGVASEVEILPVKVIGRGEGAAARTDDSPDPKSQDFQQETAFADVVARGVLYAIRSHAKVMNLSLGYSIHDDSELMRRMVALAQSQGILVVAAAGNQSSRTPVYPCRYAGVVCVASFSADGSISHFSDFGDAVDIAAPGHKILSSWPLSFYPSFFTERKGYDFKNGTSMASPFVAGVLARLLNHGFKADEAYARMMLGARPSLSPTAMSELTPKFTLSGNVDLKRAFEVSPQPLILPEIKEPVLLPLDRQRQHEVKSAKFQLSLKNFWRAGSGVRIEVTLASPQLRFADGALQLVRVFDGWEQGGVRKVEGELSWPRSTSLLDLPGDFYFEITVSGAGMQTRSFKKSAEFFVPVRPMGVSMVSADSRIQRIATDLRTQGLPADFSLKPISCLGGGESEDLLLITGTSKFKTLQILKKTNEAGLPFLKRTGGLILDQSKEKLFAFSCLDYEGSGTRGYAVTSANTADKKFAFSYLDADFRPRRLKTEFSSDTVTMPEAFRWLKAASGQALSPAWIARGRKPKSELPAFDPWEVRPADQVNPQDQRFYVLGMDGLHTLAAPDSFRFAALLKATPDELLKGTATVLLFKGQDYVLDFYTAQISELRFSTPLPLRFSEYHRLAGLKPLPLWSDSGAAGTAFFETGAGGKMRFSVLTADRGFVQSILLSPVKLGDYLTELMGAYLDASSQQTSAFIRSRFELYFYDANSGGTLATDLKQYDEVTRHLPMRLEGRPALLMPEGQGSGLTTEIVAPRESAATGRLEFTRPAGLKTWGLEGCELIQMLSTSASGAGGGSSDLVARMVYFCGDHFVQVGW